LPSPRHVILASLGTDGDVLPYVGLGVALRRRGHRATLVAAEDFRDTAAVAGLEFRPLASREENRELLHHPDFWSPLKGPLVGARWGCALMPRHFELFFELGRAGDTVFVASPALVAARVVHEKLGRPLATPILQPWMIRSNSSPPVMPLGLTLPRWAPRPAAALYWRAIDQAGAALMGRSLNRLREPLGLPPVRRVFGWWLSPQLVLAMFPPWFGPPQADWDPQIKLTGFPRYDGATGPRPLDEHLLTWCRSGPPVVAFTFGTGMVHGAALFRAAADACRLLGVRGLLLTRHTAQLPSPLPPGVRHVSFAPFKTLFPQCAAVVHHGGIGTIAEAFAAGVPQVVLPVAYDQKDNAIRVKRLGAGDWSRAGRASGPKVAALLKGVMTEPTKSRCREIAGRFGGEDPLEVAADAVESLMADDTSAVSGSPPRRSAPASPTVP
jgi:UDP:flavonoid glycosyltransferase YjiC (YdhE family)